MLSLRSGTRDDRPYLVQLPLLKRGMVPHMPSTRLPATALGAISHCLVEATSSELARPSEEGFRLALRAGLLAALEGEERPMLQRNNNNGAGFPVLIIKAEANQ